MAKALNAMHKSNSPTIAGNLLSGFANRFYFAWHFAHGQKKPLKSWIFDHVLHLTIPMSYFSLFQAITWGSMVPIRFYGIKTLFE